MESLQGIDPRDVQFAVAFGNPFDGIILYGPFDNADVAVSYANREAKGNEVWMVVPLLPVSAIARVTTLVAP